MFPYVSLVFLCADPRSCGASGASGATVSSVATVSEPKPAAQSHHPHAPGATMTVVTQTPSNDSSYDFWVRKSFPARKWGHLIPCD